MRSLLALPIERVANHLVRYAFETYDNVYCAPAWWEGLGRSERLFLVNRANIGGLPYLLGTPNPYSLKDNGMTFVIWSITRIPSSFVDLQA